jgi:hypothetical protein
VARRTKHLPTCDTPAGLAAAMKFIGRDAADFLLHVKGFKPSAKTARLAQTEADRRVGGYLYFDKVAADFRTFRKLHPDGRRAHPEQGAVHAIAESYTVLRELAMACGERIAGAVPAAFGLLSEEDLGRVIQCSVKAAHSHATLKGPAFQQSDFGSARGRKATETANRDWADRFLEGLVKECAIGKRRISRADLLNLVAERLQDEEPDLELPEDAAILTRMARWEREGAYVRYDPVSGRPSFIPKPTRQPRAGASTKDPSSP